MSLDVHLTQKYVDIPAGSGIFVRYNGQTKEISREEFEEKFPGCEPFILVDLGDDQPYLYSANITHNLGQMATEAGIYKALWRPEEINVNKAKDLIELLQAGLDWLERDSERFKEFNPKNGWGDYNALVSFTRDYLDACKQYPDAEVSISR